MSKWIEATTLPPESEDFGDFIHSKDVLITNGRFLCVGYAQKWKNDEYPTEWKQYGRDSYTAGTVTHWMPLPALPDAQEEDSEAMKACKLVWQAVEAQGEDSCTVEISRTAILAVKDALDKNS